MSDFPEPDEFDEVYVDRNEHLTYDVVGRSIDHVGNIKFRIIIGNFENKAIAEAFIRVYTDKYVWANFFPNPMFQG